MSLNRPFSSVVRLFALSLASAAIGFSAIPFDARLVAIEVDPSDSNRFYASTVGGILKSENRGATWEQIPIFPLGQPQPRLQKVRFDLKNTSVLYAYSEGNTTDPLVGIWRSPDRGLSWQKISPTLSNFQENTTLETLLVAPSDGSVLYAVARRGSTTVTYQSTNAGADWHPFTNGGTITVAPDNAYTIYGIRNGSSVHRSEDGGKTWKLMGTTWASTNNLNGIGGLAISPVDPNLMIASMTGPTNTRNGIFRSVNGGVSWENVRVGGYIGVNISQNNPNEVLVGDCCGLDLYYSNDAGRTFRTLPRVLQGSSDRVNLGPTSSTFDHSRPGQLLAPIASGGLLTLDPLANLWRKVEGTYTPTAVISGNMQSVKVLREDTSTISNSFTITAAEGSTAAGFRISAPTVEGDNLSVTVTRDGSDPENPIPALLMSRSGKGASSGVHNFSIGIPVTGAANQTVLLNGSYEVLETPESPGVFLGSRFQSLGSFAGLASRDGIIYAGQLGKLIAIHPNGTVETVAGTGTNGYSGDNGSAKSARISSPGSIALAPDGTIYFYDNFNYVIRAIAPNGIIRTVAGVSTGGSISITAGSSVSSVRFLLDAYLAVRPNGQLLIGHSGRVWSIENGAFQIAEGGGTTSPADGVLSRNVSFGSISGLNTDEEGRVLVVAQNRLFRISSTGTLTLIAGSTSSNNDSSSDDARRRQLRIDRFGTRNGYFYILDNTANVIWRVDRNFKLADVAFNGTGGTASGCTGARYVPNPAGVSRGMLVAENDTVYVSTYSSGLTELWLPTNVSIGSAAPTVVPEGILDAAAFRNSISPGGLASIFGANISTSTVSASALPLPSQLGGAVACIDSKVAPMIFASPGQINVQAPFGMEPGTRFSRYFNATGGTAPIPVTVEATTPEVFRDGNGRGIVMNANNTQNLPNNGAVAGEYVVVYLNGVGEVDPAAPTGTPSPSGPLSVPKAGFGINIGNTHANVYFLGLSPGFIGLAQANVQIPALPPGEHELVISIGGRVSQPVHVTVK